MKINKSIIIEAQEIPALYEEINEVTGNSFSDIDVKSHEGQDFARKYPFLFKLHNILQSEIMKEQSTFNYERIGDEG